MHAFLTTLNAIAPIVLCLVAGKLLTRAPALRDVDWASLEKVMFHVFLPALIFSAIVAGDFALRESWKLATVFVIAQTALGLAAFAHARSARLPAASMTSLFQNAVRWNNIIPLALAATLYGDTGLEVVAVALAVMVPLANISCIVVIEYALPRSAGASMRAKLTAVLKNPLIIACIAGFGVKVTGVELPSALSGTLDILAAATLGVGLLVVGASLSLRAIRRARLHIAAAIALKVICMPLLTLALTVDFGIDGVARTVAVLCAAAPTAMQGYIVARSMGGDAELMSSLITTGHLAAGVTMPLMLWLAISI
ncbi:MAG: AEC family transporter [Gammaproteobacteria bacterium]|nr:AEC family transporter [Gammaproteobacteria bacterium]